ncbi:DUF3367 domain-containing protein, partial [Frankia sp. AiPs1]|nr:DUF3367 domain-containing protein [Frankia sp. AiPs1]
PAGRAVRVLWTGLAMVALVLVAGPVALTVPVFVWLGRSRPRALGWLAAIAMLGAGIGVAVDPNSQPGSGHGAFGVPVQVLGSLAFAAVLAALACWVWGRPAEPDIPETGGPGSGGPGSGGPGSGDRGYRVGRRTSGGDRWTASKRLD